MLDEKMPGCYHYYNRLCPIQCCIVLMGEINFLVQRRKTLDFFNFGDVCITCFLTVVSLARMFLLILKKYGIICRKFLKHFHLGNFKHVGGNFKKVAEKMDTISHYFTLIIIAFTFFGLILFNLSPFTANISSGAFKNPRPENVSLRFSISYEYPGFRPEDYFIFTTLLNIYFSYSCTIFVCAIDLLIVLMVFQIIGHIEVLRRNLDDFPSPKKSDYDNLTNEQLSSVEKFTEEENRVIHYLLIESVNHHRYIVGFVEEISNLFGPMMGVNYLYQLVGCCLLLLECSQLDSQALARFGPLTIISVAQCIEISVIFEIVASMSEKLIDNVYYLPWQCMDMKNQRSVYIFFNRIQRTIHVTCMGVTPIGVQSMASILKTTFSYFTFLRSMDALSN